MQSLNQELRDTICRHVRSASHEELTAVVVALTAELTEIPVLSPPKLGPVGDRFALAQGDQVVIDQKLGLMWSRAELTEDRLNWEAADKLCRELRLGGYSDWRLPTVDELFALADRTRHEPAIDTKYFSGCKPNFYWTGTPYAPSPGDSAWGVYFYNGLAGCYDRHSGGFVRAVRASQ